MAIGSILTNVSGIRKECIFATDHKVLYVFIKLISILFTFTSLKTYLHFLEASYKRDFLGRAEKVVLRLQYPLVNLSQREKCLNVLMATGNNL